MNNSHCSLIRVTLVQFTYYKVPFVTERWCSGLDWDADISGGDKLKGNEAFFAVC